MRRIIVTDGDDLCIFEWMNKDGLDEYCKEWSGRILQGKVWTDPAGEGSDRDAFEALMAE